jgi:RHS repeat-associated protein
VTDGGAAVYYVYSLQLGQVAMEVNVAGVRRAYVYAGGKQVAQQSVDGQFYWLHTNHLGSSRAMTDVNGNLVYKGQFDPYEQALLEWGSASLNTKKFTGYERDGATGLDYAGARMYNSGRGRFMQPDPLGCAYKGKNPDPLGAAKWDKPQTLNRYSYVSNDPVNLVDPTGLDGEGGDCLDEGLECIAAIIGYVGGISALISVCGISLGIGCIGLLLAHPVLGLLVASKCSKAIKCLQGPPEADLQGNHIINSKIAGFEVEYIQQVTLNKQDIVPIFLSKI